MQHISESSITSLLMVTTACVTKLSAVSAEIREQHSRGLGSSPLSDDIRLTKNIHRKKSIIISKLIYFVESKLHKYM